MKCQFAPITLSTELHEAKAITRRNVIKVVTYSACNFSSIGYQNLVKKLKDKITNQQEY